MKPHQAQTTNVIAKLAMVPKHLSKGGHEESCRGENQQSIYFFCVLWAGAALQLQEGDGGRVEVLRVYKQPCLQAVIQADNKQRKRSPAMSSVFSCCFFYN